MTVTYRDRHDKNTWPSFMHHCQGVLTRTDKSLPVIVFTLATNSAEGTENVKVLYLQKFGIEPVASGIVVEVVALQLMGCVASNFYSFFSFFTISSDTGHLRRS